MSGDRSEPVDVGRYREVIGRFATGVGVVTSVLGERCYAMTANSITSVSRDPLLLLVSFMQDSDTGRAVRKTGHFGLSVLGAKRGREVARTCARKLAADETDQLEGVETYMGPHGIPLIRGAIECLACTVEQLHAIGDHDVAIARGEPVEEAQVPGEPLVFFDGGFWQLGEPSG